MSLLMKKKTIATNFLNFRKNFPGFGFLKVNSIYIFLCCSKASLWSPSSLCMNLTWQALQEGQLNALSSIIYNTPITYKQALGGLI